MANSGIHHRPTECPKCGVAAGVYELDVGGPKFIVGRSMGPLHLAAHGCVLGGDHLLLQESFTLKEPKDG